MTRPAMLNIMTRKNRLNKYDAAHNTVCYMDDAYQCVAVVDPAQPEDYLNTFFTIFTAYFNTNKLALNKEKTSPMIYSHPRHISIRKEVTIENDEAEDNIEQSSCIKILGFLSNQRDRHHSAINKLIADCTLIFLRLSNVQNILTFKHRHLYH